MNGNIYLLYLLLFTILYIIFYLFIKNKSKGIVYLITSDGDIDCEEPKNIPKIITIDEILYYSKNFRYLIYYTSTFREGITWYLLKNPISKNRILNILNVGDIIAMEGEYYPGDFGNHYIRRIEKIEKDKIIITTLKGKFKTEYKKEEFIDLVLGKLYKLKPISISEKFYTINNND